MRYVFLILLITLFVSEGYTQNGATTSDLDKNWIVVKRYNADGTVHSISKQYFSKQGDIIQSQSRNMTAGQVMASQLVNDAFGRPAVSSMWAPINNGNFGLKPNFLLNSAGTNYNYKNFDDLKTNNPDPIGSQQIPGTVGWYFSDHNTQETRVSASDYPVHRNFYYSDGTGETKGTTDVGDAFKMGQGRIFANFMTPVVNELDHYLQVRNKYFTAAEMGILPTSLANNAYQSSVRSTDNKELIAILDKDGKALMSGMPGNDLTITNTITLSAQVYQVTTPTGPSGSGCAFGQATKIKLFGGNSFNLTDPSNNQLNLQGPYNGETVSFSPSNWGTVIKSDEPFSIVFDDKQGPLCTSSQVSMVAQQTGADRKLYYFKIFSDGSPVTLSGDYTLYDMASETAVSLLPGDKLNQGYYKVVANTGSVSLTYSNSYGNISYNFYNLQGYLISTVGPEGVKKLIQNLNAYTNKTDIPYMNFFDYNDKNQIIATHVSDGGKHEYIYREDSKLRFSQNSQQKIHGWFSYLNYDKWGRPIESGEYRPTGDLTFEGLKTNNSILQNTSSTGGLINGANKHDWVRTKYDMEDNTHGVVGYAQTFLRNRVSMTESANSKSWHSYDSEGRIIWTIKWINGLGYKTIDNSYDATGRATKVVFQKNVPMETFVHYYEYDADGKIEKVYTNTTDNFLTKTLQVKYIYYLHGPLKRREIATNLQGIDYTYTLDGTLKAINHSDKTKDPGNDGVANGFLPDAFGELLEYYENDFVRTGDAALRNELNISDRETGRLEYKAANSITFNPGFQTEDDANFTTIIDESSSFAKVGIGSTDAPPQHSGNIRGMSWFSKKPTASGMDDNTNMYVYKYDERYQFSEATWGSVVGNKFVPQLGVNKEQINGIDQNGNILNLVRTNGTGVVTDDFSYNYVQSPKPSNRLASVTQQTIGQTYATYEYDSEGRVIAEIPGPGYGPGPAKYIKYDVGGNVTAVYSNPGMTAGSLLVSYVYDENGGRIKKLSYSSGVLQTTTYYVYAAGGQLASIYEQPAGSGISQKELPINAGARVGIYLRQNNAYRYELTDHIGNVRAVFVKISVSNIDMVISRDYYPFGSEIPGRTHTDADGYRYGYQGGYSEKDPETGWNAFQLRMYDSRIWRWLSVDPKGEHWSPYTAMGNNPVTVTDPDGGCEKCPSEAKLGDRFYEKGYMYEATEFSGGVYGWAKWEGGAITRSDFTDKYFKVFWHRYQKDMPIIQDGDNWSYRYMAERWKRVEDSNRDWNNLTLKFLGILAFPVLLEAAPAGLYSTLANTATKAAPVVGNYIRKGTIEWSKQYISNGFDESKIDYFDVLVSTLSPIKGVWAKVGQEAVTASIDLKYEEGSWEFKNVLNETKSLRLAAVDFGVGSLKAGIKGTVSIFGESAKGAGLQVSKFSNDALDVVMGMGKAAGKTLLQ